MNINILKKHIAVGEKRPFNTSDAASVRKEQKLDPKELREKLNDFNKENISQIGLNLLIILYKGFLKNSLMNLFNNLMLNLRVWKLPFEENNVLDWVLYSHNEKR